MTAGHLPVDARRHVHRQPSPHRPGPRPERQPPRTRRGLPDLRPVVPGRRPRPAAPPLLGGRQGVRAPARDGAPRGVDGHGLAPHRGRRGGGRSRLDHVDRRAHSLGVARECDLRDRCGARRRVDHLRPRRHQHAARRRRRPRLVPRNRVLGRRARHRLLRGRLPRRVDRARRRRAPHRVPAPLDGGRAPRRRGRPARPVPHLGRSAPLPAVPGLRRHRRPADRPAAQPRFHLPDPSLTPEGA